MGVPSVSRTSLTPADSTPQAVATHLGSVVGVIRSRAAGDIIPGASVEIESGHLTATADSTGTYLFSAIPSGTAELRVVARGYEPLTVVISVPSGGTVRVDILLTRRTIALAPVRVVSGVPDTTVLTRTTGTADMLGVWHWYGDAASAITTTGEPDVFRMLSDNPNVVVRPDGPPTVMDHGSGVDEMLVLFDGFPIWSPVHAGGVLSIITPDAVDGLALHDDAMSAQYGGRLASVLDLHPRVIANDSVNGSVAFGSIASRVMAERPVHVGTALGEALLAVRRSNADFFPYRNTSQPATDRWRDGIGMFTLTQGASAVRVLALASSDQLGQIPWATRTLGLNWTRQLTPTAHLETRIWQADFTTKMSQGTDGTASALDNAVHQSGVASQLAWNNTTLGTSLERMDVHYRVTAASNASGDSSIAPPAPLNLWGTPTIVTVFAEQRWVRTNGLWLAQTGLRATGLLGGPTFLEPRLSVAVRITNAITAMASYVRTHQFIQSLRNSDAPLSALIGIDLPVAAGAGGVPVAQSDAVSAGLAAHMGPHVRLGLTAYVRRLSGLVMADPMSSTLFATRGFESVTGRATGVGAALAGQADGGRVTWQLTSGVGRMLYSAAGTSTGQPPALSQMSTASLAFHVDRLTQLRAVGWRATGPQAMWFAQMPNVGTPDGTTPEGEGDPSRGIGHPLDQTVVEQRHLPQYVRFDLTATHEWPAGPRHGSLAAFLTVANVLNRPNVASYGPTAAAGGPPQAITLVPRSLLAGITWRY